MLSMWYRGKHWFDMSVVWLGFLVGLIVGLVLVAAMIVSA